VLGTLNIAVNEPPLIVTAEVKLTVVGPNWKLDNEVALLNPFPVIVTVSLMAP